MINNNWVNSFIYKIEEDWRRVLHSFISFNHLSFAESASVTF
jgi:hypothetical protein